ncbi:MAG TPA: LysE family transporter [Opitutaceae bacterium]|jgi:threonine/homoserine/homoserine lactone efflux protein
MHPRLLLEGLAIGFSIAAPVGPIGMLCIRRSLQDGMVSGLLTGLGAAAADAAYGAVAAFGLSAVSSLLVAHRSWIGVAGGLFLLWLGARTLLRAPSGAAEPALREGPAWTFLSTLLLTLSNPATILSFVAIFAGLRPGGSGETGSALLVLGVFCGSCAWWLILSGGVALLRRRLAGPWMRAVQALSGAILVVFGAYAISHA